MAFPGGLKAYLDDPREILRWRPSSCGSCGRHGILHLHRWRSRFTSVDGSSIKTEVALVRCRWCWVTTTMLPDGILPKMQYSLDTIGAAIEAYQVPEASYRSVALDISGCTLPSELTLSGFFGGVEAPPLGPGHVFRWMARFSAGAADWWAPIAAQTQDRLTHALSPPAAPKSIAAKGRSPAKREDITNAWMLLWVLRFLLDLLGRRTVQWPYALLHSSRRTPLLDHTGWFAVRLRAPP